MPEIRHYLREWRKHSHLTQSQVVARLIDLADPDIPTTEATLSRIETGKMIYNERMLNALAHIYDCEPWELLGRDPAKAGELIDMVQHLSPHQREQAFAVIEGLVLAETRRPWHPAPEDNVSERLRPLRRTR